MEARVKITGKKAVKVLGAACLAIGAAALGAVTCINKTKRKEI